MNTNAITIALILQLLDGIPIYIGQPFKEFIRQEIVDRQEHPCGNQSEIPFAMGGPENVILGVPSHDPGHDLIGAFQPQCFQFDVEQLLGEFHTLVISRQRTADDCHCFSAKIDFIR